MTQTTISDLVQISPQDFSKYSAVAIEDNLNEKYANKVSIPRGECEGVMALIVLCKGYTKDRAVHSLL